MIKELLGKRITELRKQQNISQEELAEKLDISQKSLSKIETGRNFLTSETLEKLLKALDIKCTELFNFEHLQAPENLYEEIQKHLEKIKTNKNAMTLLYKIVRSISER